MILLGQKNRTGKIPQQLYRAGEPFSAKGHLHVYNITQGPYQIINLNISLL